VSFFARDLFGQPIDTGRGKRGRPRHIPTTADRALVGRLHGEGQSQTRIAAALGITVPTLLLNYPDELQSKSQARLKRIHNEGDTQNGT